MLAHYGQSNIEYVQHIFPLPYHLSAAWTAAEGVEITGALVGPSAIFDWMDAVFEHQESFGYDFSLNATRGELINKFDALWSGTFAKPPGTFATAYNNGTLNNNARLSWKYGCSRGVSGTPFFFINGVLAPAGADWTLSQWQALIDPLLAGA